MLSFPFCCLEKCATGILGIEMGSQIPGTNDRTRTYWTPTMERYFIDLMLEQMHRGNRIGHTFSKQAWTDMLTVFNAKFGSQYDKDVLKSRYTNLWKQFNGVKNLLGQSGFSWDESRQMVVADDYVWNAYIKAHPDARSYKTKAMLNFSDLCLIYGYTTADGRYSRSSHDLDFDDEVQGVNMGDGMCNLPSTNNERPRTEWNADMDQYFIELMLDQVGRGNKVDNTFNKQAWTDMLALFNAKFGPQHGKRVLRHRYKKLWKYYGDVTVILKQNGFSWDETQLMITADNDVWDAYIKAHPHARTYRLKTLPNYNDLVLIYGEAIDEGNVNNVPQEYDISRATAGEGKKSVNPAGDRTRTFWTPPMDRYLIDLLLDQVHRGNKLGQTFITQAWIDMVTSFNVKFGSHYDKDVLKNRYKHLRRLYNDIKILLEQSGFSWDEARDMVSAEDSVWDAYIKSHPDARSYRVKTVPSYHKLCVIFGQESCDGRYNRLAQNVGTDGDVTVLMTGYGNEENDHFPSTIHHHGIEWTAPMDRFFIDLLLEQVHEGNKIDRTFNEQAWIHMVESFNENFALLLNKNELENQYICLMKQYDDISDLLNHSGFVWDEAKQMVVANNDVWEVYIKEHPDAVSYKDKFLGSYSDLCKIFKDEVLDGRPSGQVLGVETDHSAPEVILDRAPGNLQTQGGDFHLFDQHRKRSTATPDIGRASKAPKTDQEMQKMVSRMAGAVTRLASQKGNKNYSIIESAVDALQALPDIDDELLLDACDLLEDEKKAKTFLALDVTLRKKWLLRKLRS
ncbi:PREDICTED: L10-interacting MYB domain-containing protein isoform X1 [Theobroma cacao]|uniref:L10-interacting MYB domain-containing protein isoform X1 n=2 Tax=Theobroma cacao TaxID=3641 RepID=A0AB32WZR6_THECC|nr:PREDICTED: L10-interacting MYB domain-containing protein isoform X1 [Theobroma cacao]